jgi:hypothetical protein
MTMNAHCVSARAFSARRGSIARGIASSFQQFLRLERVVRDGGASVDMWLWNGVVSMHRGAATTTPHGSARACLHDSEIFVFCIV